MIWRPVRPQAQRDPWLWGIYLVHSGRKNAIVRYRPCYPILNTMGEVEMGDLIFTWKSIYLTHYKNSLENSKKVMAIRIDLPVRMIVYNFGPNSRIKNWISTFAITCLKLTMWCFRPNSDDFKGPSSSGCHCCLSIKEFDIRGDLHYLVVIYNSILLTT